MTKSRTFIALFALIGAVLGALIGYLFAPGPSRYSATAQVALLPAANLTTSEASAFWEVLTRGQISRTAAVLYEDRRWLPSAAKAAKVDSGDLSLTAAALPETTLVEVTVEAGSRAAAESALNDVLTTATPDVTTLSYPYAVKVLWPPKGNGKPVPEPSSLQVMAAGVVGGALLGGGVGWFLGRSRRTPTAPKSVRSADVDERWPTRP